MTAVDDLILISVDDHLIEPPDLFADHLDGQVPGPGPQARAQRGGQRRVDLRRRRHGDRGAERRRRAAQGGVRHRAAEPRRGPARLLRRARAGEGHGRRRRAGVDELPVVPDLHRPAVRQRRRRPLARPRAGLQRLAHRRVVRRPPRPLHPDGGARHLGRRADRRRGAPVRRRRAATRSRFTENPAALGYPSFHDEYWDPLWRACCRHRHRAVDPPRLVGPAVDPGRRLARPT